MKSTAPVAAANTVCICVPVRVMIAVTPPTYAICNGGGHGGYADEATCLANWIDDNTDKCASPGILT